MPREIERKFLLKDGFTHMDLWMLKYECCAEIQQGYFSCYDPSIRVRIINEFGGESVYKATLTVKSKDKGFTRFEFEYPIPVEDAHKMIATYCDGRIVRKIRRVIDIGGDKWEVDSYLGKNEGFLTAEIELQSEDQIVSLPDWIGKEVTGVKEYTNHQMAIENGM